MQWQHGNFTVNGNGSLTLTPYAVDGRQLVSDPCKNDVGRYTIYNQTELFQVGMVAMVISVENHPLANNDHSPSPCPLINTTASNVSTSTPLMGHL